jgi:hypothetical protein
LNDLFATPADRKERAGTLQRTLIEMKEADTLDMLTLDGMNHYAS